jgi:adenine-specific DNA-methyltransferase
MAVLWKNLSGIENGSISSSIKRYSRFNRKKMELFSRDIDLRYLLAIINSKYASVLLRILRSGDYHIVPEYLRNLPIPVVSGKKQEPIISFVDQMLAMKKREQAETVPQTKTMIGRQIAALDEQIDKAVYKLYGLTEEEIKVVEGKSEK